MTENFLGRQPIFDFDHRIVGYEVLLHSMPGASESSVVNGQSGSAEKHGNGRLEHIAGQYPVFIKLARNHLLKPLSLPPGQVVFEIPENIEFVRDKIKTMQALLKAGYRLALDDYASNQESDQILRYAHLVRLDVREHSRAELSHQVERLRAYKVKLLAHRIEDEDTYRFCRGLGFDLYQGGYFSRPRIARGRRLKPSQLGVIKLMRELYRKDANFRKIEKLISEDASLSNRLLKMINSDSFSMGKKIESIRRALVMVGQSMISNWISMLALSGMDEKDDGLLELALVRARLCELMAPQSAEEDRDRYFSVGLFSILDQLMRVPMDEIVRDIPFSDEVADALMNQEGPLGEILNCAIGFEQLEEQGANTCQGCDAQLLADKYIEALDWVQGTRPTLK